MKKSFVLVSTLAMVLGVGVAVGAHQGRAEKVEAADPITLYCKCNKSWWTDGGAAIGVHQWGGETTNTEWPGTKGTLVDGETDVWQFTVQSDREGFIFTRMNPSDEGNQDWGAKTANLTLPTGGNNLYTITSESAVWGDPGVTGTWSVYTPKQDPSLLTNSFYVYDESKVLGNTFANINLYGFGQDDSTKGMVWPGSHNGMVDGQTVGKTSMYQATLSQSYPKAVINNGTVQTVDIENIADHAGDVLKIKSTQTAGKYDVEWKEVSDFTDYPSADGYYIVGSKTNNRYEGATLMLSGASVLDPNNHAEYYGYEGKKDETIKVRMYQEERVEGADVWGFFAENEYSVGIGEADSNANLKFLKDATIDIFAKWEEVSTDNWQINFYISEHAERYTVSITHALFDGKTKTGTETGTDQMATEGAVFTPTPGLTKTGYVFRGYFTDADCKTAYVPNASHDSDFTLYAKFIRVCYYLFGDATFLDGHAWDVNYASPVAAGSGNNRLEGVAVIPNTASEESPVKIKPLLWDGEMQAETYTLGEPRTFVTIDGDGNFSFTEGGTYAFYVNNENKVWFNIGEYVFHTKFLTEVGGTCIYEGGTNITTLQGVWADQKLAYNALSDADKKNITDVGFDGGDAESSNDRLRMIAMYHYIVTKYGTAAFEDFIWGQKDIEPMSVLYQSPIVETSSVAIIVIVSVTIATISAGLFFILKKKESK